MATIGTRSGKMAVKWAKNQNFPTHMATILALLQSFPKHCVELGLKKPGEKLVNPQEECTTMLWGGRKKSTLLSDSSERRGHGEMALREKE